MNSQQPRRLLALAAVSVLISAPLAASAFAQSPAPNAAQPPASATTAPQPDAAAPAAAATAAASTPAAASPQSTTPGQKPAIGAADIKGLNVFGSEGRQVGKVIAVNEDNGAVKSIDVQTNGFFGFFKRTYEIPFSAVKKSGGKIELTMTSQEAMSKMK
jgi:sporulation protein YlmC with PRC-barrel domain